MQMFSLLGGGAFQVVEQGAGEGHLAQDILDAIAEEAPELYSQLKYTLVEVSQDNRQRQSENLEKHIDRVAWCAANSGVQESITGRRQVRAWPSEEHMDRL